MCITLRNPRRGPTDASDQRNLLERQIAQNENPELPRSERGILGVVATYRSRMGAPEGLPFD